MMGGYNKSGAAEARYLFPSLAAAVVLTAFMFIATGCIQRPYDFSPSRFDNIASYIAGLPVPPESKIYNLTLRKEYVDYKSKMDAAWDSYRKQDIDTIITWRSDKLHTSQYRRVFYPFSGPDILNAMEFFPNADEFILVGMEPPGLVTDPLAMGTKQRASELLALQNSLHTLMKLNYFRTLEMRKELDNWGFNNIISVMIFFLRRYDCHIVDVRNVYIDSKGNYNVATSKTKTGPVNGIEVIFETNDSSGPKKACYFKADLSDTGLKSNHFMDFLNKQKYRTTFMKSAGYLAGFPYFSTLRNYIIANSEYIIEDDAGIPVKFFPQKDWNIKVYGTYRTLPIFKKYFQPELDALAKASEKSTLPFCYGYGYTPEESHLITLERR